MPINRESEDTARQIVETILPNDEERHVWLNFLATVARSAATMGTSLWSLSLRDNPNSVRLNVGRIEIVSLTRDARKGITIALFSPAVPTDLLTELTQKHIVLPIRAVADLIWLQVSAEQFYALAQQLLAPCLQAVEKAAGSVRTQTPYYDAHSPGALDYVNQMAGTAIAPPIYNVTTSEPDREKAPMTEKQARLLAAFEAFRNDPLEQVRVRVRRLRAGQIRALLSNPAGVDLAAFNREVWLLESAVKLEGQDFKGRIMSATPLTASEINRLNAALDKETEEAFEFHGNAVWRPASGIFGPTESDPNKKRAALQDALEILNDSTLKPAEKAELLLTVPGLGPSTANGLVMLFHPSEFALKNNESVSTLGKLGLGYPISTQAEFQQSAHELKQLIGADDFLELDLFLYRYSRQGQVVKPVEKLPAIQDITEVVAQPNFWWVCQGGTYGLESNGGYVWAPQLSKGGVPIAHHVNVSRLKLGDIVIHYANGAIRAIGLVTTAPKEAPRPTELPEGEWQNNGYLAKIEYQELGQPIGLQEIPLPWRGADVGPFDRNGSVKQGYLFSVTPNLVAKLAHQFADRLPNILAHFATPHEALVPSFSVLPNRIVKISPGPNGAFWDECLQGGYICVGWDETGDLNNYQDPAALFNIFTQQGWNKTGSRRSAKVNELWTLRELEPGDVIVANRGASEVLGVGRVVAPGYRFRDDRDTFKHTVTVDWDTSVAKFIPKQGSWPLVTVAPVSAELYRFIIGETSIPPPVSGQNTIGEDTDPDDELELSVVEPEYVQANYFEPSFDQIREAIQAQKLRLPERDLRRYHLSLKTRGFVVLSGLSGTGKTWLAQAYAEAVGAKHLLVPVAPNWTTNEDLLGYHNPLSRLYHDTEFSRFLRQAGKAFKAAEAAGRTPQPYHLILDEMNLARVEYYFARFLSAMEVRARQGSATMELAAGDTVVLPPNFMFVGTVNMDETTHSFADKVYDRAQLIELGVDRASLAEHLAGAPHATLLLGIWDAVHPVAPFAFRVLDEISAYIEQADALGMDISWEEALDEQLLQKVLPKLKGAEPRVGTALNDFCRLTKDICPLSYHKADRILEGYRAHGIASYF